MIIPARRRLGAMQRQRGVILFVTMIALIILMISGIALVRSFDSSMAQSGNIAFKRDLINQSERGITAAVSALNSGGALSTDAVRQGDSIANNYSSTTLPSDGHGIPTMLTGASSWTMTGSDITDSTSKASIRYVIDRMCSATGAETQANCVYLVPKIQGGDSREQRATPSNLQIVYRISVRVTLPNNTQTFIQTTGYK